MQNNSLYVLDLDNTLCTCSAKTGIVKDNKIVKKISDTEASTYNLKHDESFDFTEYTNTAFWVETSRPIVKIFDFAKEISKNVTINDRVIVLTARPKVDNVAKMKSTLIKFGLSSRIIMEFSGDAAFKTHSQVNKIELLRKKYLGTGRFSAVTMIDDNKNNIKAFVKLKYIYPQISFIPIWVHNGIITPFSDF